MNWRCVIMVIIKMIKKIIHLYASEKNWAERTDEPLKCFRPSDEELAFLKAKGIY